MKNNVSSTVPVWYLTHCFSLQYWYGTWHIVFHCSTGTVLDTLFFIAVPVLYLTLFFIAVPVRYLTHCFLLQYRYGTWHIVFIAVPVWYLTHCFSLQYWYDTWHVFHCRSNNICSHTTKLTNPMYFNWLFWTTVTLASLNSALPDDGDYTEVCRSCFNVNFNTPFKAILLCISWQ
jgi:hypothetical protein